MDDYTPPKSNPYREAMRMMPRGVKVHLGKTDTPDQLPGWCQNWLAKYKLIDTAAYKSSSWKWTQYGQQARKELARYMD